MSWIFEHYIVQTILIIYCILYLSLAFACTNRSSNTAQITNRVKAGCIFNNAFIAATFILFYFSNVVYYKNSYSDEFLLILISYHIYIIFKCLFMKEGVYEIKFSTTVTNIFTCFIIAFGTFIFLL